MSISTAPQDSITDFVRLGYIHSMRFQTSEITDWEEFESVLRTIGGYNSFDPERVILALWQSFRKVMSIRAGREYSPVLYIEVPWWTNQEIGHRGTYLAGVPIAEAQRLTLAQELVVALKGAGADEADIQFTPEHGPLGKRVHWVRGWWD